MNYPAAELRGIKSPLSASLKLGTFPPEEGKEPPVHRQCRNFLPPLGEGCPVRDRKGANTTYGILNNDLTPNLSPRNSFD